MPAEIMSENELEELISNTFGGDAFDDPTYHLPNGEPVYRLYMGEKKLKVALANLREITKAAMNAGVIVGPELIDVAQWLKKRAGEGK